MSGNSSGDQQDKNTQSQGFTLSSSTGTQQQDQQQASNQASNQASQVNPWDPTQPLLQSILGNLGSINTGLTPQQQTAIASLWGGAAQTPNFAGQGSNAVNDLFKSSTLPEQGMLNSAYGDYKKTLAPYTDPNYLDPRTNPEIAGLLNTTAQDVGNNINSMWGAAGRDLSPGHAQALARGLSQGEAGILTDQYNKNVAAQQGAAGSLFGAGGSTASGVAGLSQADLANRMQGISAAGAIPGLASAPGSAMLGAANAGYGLPLSNIGGLLGMVSPIAGLGQSSTGSATGSASGTGAGTSSFTGSGTQISNKNQNEQQTTQTPWGPAIAGTALNAFLSDIRAKENIEPVGLLFDGLPIYAYNYKGEPAEARQIGLLAQEVQERVPDAVSEHDGLLYVQYGKATEMAAELGQEMGA